MEKRGITLLPNTWPILRFWPGWVMTAPPFISEPVPTMVSTQPTGMMGFATSSMRRKYLSQGSSSHQAETDTALA